MVSQVSLPFSHGCIWSKAKRRSVGFAMDVTEDSLRQSDCTSCAVTQDKSAYWAPALYFVHANGSAELVEQDGGMLV